MEYLIPTFKLFTLVCDNAKYQMQKNPNLL